MAQLLIRPSLNDHQVIADLPRAPTDADDPSGASPVSQLVADAHIAIQRPTLGESAHEAGIPFLVDPTTMLLQTDVDPKSRWASLPFASARALSSRKSMSTRWSSTSSSSAGRAGGHPDHFALPVHDQPQDPTFAMSIRLLAATTRYIHDNDVLSPGGGDPLRAAPPVRNG